MLNLPFFTGNLKLLEEGGNVSLGGGTIFNLEAEITCALIADDDCRGAAVTLCCRSFYALMNGEGANGGQMLEHKTVYINITTKHARTRHSTQDDTAAAAPHLNKHRKLFLPPLFPPWPTILRLLRRHGSCTCWIISTQCTCHGCFTDWCKFRESTIFVVFIKGVFFFIIGGERGGGCFFVVFGSHDLIDD